MYSIVVKQKGIGYEIIAKQIKKGDKALNDEKTKIDNDTEVMRYHIVDAPVVLLTDIEN